MLHNIAVFISGALFAVLALVLGFVLLMPVGQYIALSLLHPADSCSTLRARDAGLHLLLLETGPKSVEAIKLYERLGYVERDPFYPHLASPHSVFTEKMLVH